MTDDVLYWVWLQQVLGYASKKVRTVEKMYKTAKNFYNSGINDWKLCGCFTKSEINRMETYTLREANEIVSSCKGYHQNIITYDSNEYPKTLKNIENPPCVLYVKGKLPNFDSGISISIVGTRSATPYGISAANNLSCDLSREGIIIVSGGALGIDKAAHVGALKAGGKTVAVLGCGINYNYLSANAYMRRQICENGALISEYAPGYPAYPRNFPLRNRIISGLTLGTMVVEADEKSGSLITANLALEQNRDVFAVPGNIGNTCSSGTNALIRLGAIPVLSAQDVINEYAHKRNALTNPTNNSSHIGSDVEDLKHDCVENGLDLVDEQPDLSGLSEDAVKLYSILTNQPKYIDDIIMQSCISSSKALQLITELELNNLIDSHSGKRYSKK